MNSSRAVPFGSSRAPSATKAARTAEDEGSRSVDAVQNVVKPWYFGPRQRWAAAASRESTEGEVVKGDSGINERQVTHDQLNLEVHRQARGAEDSRPSLN